MTQQSTYPSSDMDLFSDEALIDPYPYYKELRETGAAVFLDSTGCWALPR